MSIIRGAVHGLRLSASKEKICGALCKIAEYNCMLDEIERWLRENTLET